MLKKLLIGFIVWRIFLILPIILGYTLVPIRKGYEYTLTTYFLPSTNPIGHFLLSPWANFDGVYYLFIAAKGYTVNAGFFPLFPLIIRIATSLSGTLLPFHPIQFATALLLVHAFSLGALILMYALVRLDRGEEFAWRCVWLFLLFPTSFYLISVYSEGLFILLVLASFYAARKKKWILVSLFGMLATATRIVGIALFPALFYEYIQHLGGWNTFLTSLRANIVKTLIRLLPILLVPMGLVGYLWYSIFRWGNAFAFLAAQGNFQNNRSVTSIVLIPQTLFRYGKILSTIPISQYEWWVALLELGSFFFAAGLLVVGWKKGIRLSYLMYALIALLIPASSGTFSGLPRYVLVLFPVFFCLALVASKAVRTWYMIVGAIILGILLMLFSRGYFVS